MVAHLQNRCLLVADALTDVCSVQQYMSFWMNRDETANFSQKYNPDIVKELLRPTVEKEVRIAVDQELRLELENLKISLEGKRKKKSEGQLCVP